MSNLWPLRATSNSASSIHAGSWPQEMYGVVSYKYSHFPVHNSLPRERPSGIGMLLWALLIFHTIKIFWHITFIQSYGATYNSTFVYQVMVISGQLAFLSPQVLSSLYVRSAQTAPVLSSVELVAEDWGCPNEPPSSRISFFFNCVLVLQPPSILIWQPVLRPGLGIGPLAIYSDLIFPLWFLFIWISIGYLPLAKQPLIW